MTANRPLIIRIIPLLVLVIAAAGCDPSPSLLTLQEKATLESYTLATYYMQTDMESLDDSTSRATVPVHSLSQPPAFPVSGQTTEGFQNNYPERGQRTDWLIEPTGTGSVYKVTATTTYPKKDELFDYTEEIYYVEDTDSDGDYTTADRLVRPDGTVDSVYREGFKTVFDDGSERYEQVIATFSHSDSDYDGQKDGNSGIAYNTFDYDSFDLSFPGDANWSPPADDIGDIVWSSKVGYTQRFTERVLFLEQESKVITGLRFYTEEDATPLDPNDDKVLKSAVSFERMIERVPDSGGSGGTLSDFFDILFGTGGTLDEGDTENTILTETVTVYEIQSNGRKRVKSRAVVVSGFTPLEALIEYDSATDANGNNAVTYSGL